MVLPGHIAGGYLITRALLEFTHASAAFGPNELRALTVIGTLSGELPDLDLFTKKPDHRMNPTHFPLFWFLVCALVFIFGEIAGSAFISYGAVIIFGGTMSHLIFDSIEYGVAWLWPCSKRRLAIMKPSRETAKSYEKITAPAGSWRAHYQFARFVYWRTVVFWVELIMTILAIFIFYSSFTK